MAAAIKIFVVALSLALDVFAVSIGVGVRGVSRTSKIRIGIAFASAEMGMTLIGAGIGVVVGHVFGVITGYIGFVALLGLGIYMIAESRRESGQNSLDMSRGWGLFIAALSISLDSLGIGFSILYIGVSLPIALITIGVVSIASTAAGLTLGRYFGKRIGEYAELMGGVVLALTGVAFILLKAYHLG